MENILNSLEETIEMPTNVSPEDLNYHYTSSDYDSEIKLVIPGYEEMHKCIDNILGKIKREYKRPINVLELGIGTGLTAVRILKKFPDAKYVGIDFSETMKNAAEKRLKKYYAELILGDYSKIKFPKNNDLVVSVISIHHQKTDKDKKKLFRRIYDCLRDDGAFIFGDLVTYKDQKIAAMNEALHYHNLVKNAKNEKTLREWSYHHKFLNSLAALEDQVEWLEQVGFSSVKVIYTKYNTALIYARK